MAANRRRRAELRDVCETTSAVQILWDKESVFPRALVKHVNSSDSDSRWEASQVKRQEIEFLSCLSLDQPFAHLIFHLGMNVESRRWTTARRGTIAIHATAKKSRSEFEWVNEQFDLDLVIEDADFSAVIGLADVVDMITEDQVTCRTQKWFMGPYGFVLENIFRLPEPVPAKGNRKFWHLKGSPLEATLDQLSSERIKLIQPFI
jgi:hypothetical protein